jgi:HSP20 family protein
MHRQKRCRGDQRRDATVSVLRWDPFQDLLSLQDEMNRMFDRAFGQSATRERGVHTWAPALDIAERKDAYLVTVELPGVNPNDIDVTLESNLLTIQGERHQAQDSADQQFHRVERIYGGFRRTVTLPSTVQADAIEASYDNGLLHLVVPKAKEAMPKKIAVSGGEQRQAVTAR